MDDATIKAAVDRFLSWKLPEDFCPDAGISFKAHYNEGSAYPMKHEPRGTNLLNAVQAEAMLRDIFEAALTPAPRTTNHPGWIDQKALEIAQAVAGEHNVTDVQYIARMQIAAIEGIKIAIAPSAMLDMPLSDAAELREAIDTIRPYAVRVDPRSGAHVINYAELPRQFLLNLIEAFDAALSGDAKCLDIPPETLAELRRLLDAATPGEWARMSLDDADFSAHHDGDCNGLFEGQRLNRYTLIANPEMAEMAILVADMGPANTWDDELLEANAALIVAMKRHLPALLAAVQGREADDSLALIAASEVGSQEVGVTRADREAAWEVRTEAYRDDAYSTRRVWFGGGYDRCQTIQAFARHRQQARDAGVARAARVIRVMRKIADEARVANDVIRLNKDGQGQGRIRVATAMHRIAALSAPAAPADRGS